MTTKNSPESSLRKQAQKIASALKSAERGEPVHATLSHKIKEARENKTAIKVGIIMDDKAITIEMRWETIHDCEEDALVEYILQQMKR